MKKIKAKMIFLKITNLCNLKCSYCFHNTQKNIIDYNFNPKVIDYLNSDNVVPFVKNYKMSIVIIGGEPLLHYDVVKYIIQHINKNKFYIYITTNGSLLTEDKIKFFNEENVYITTSWDGTSSLKTRTYDVISDKKDLLLNINNLRFSTLITNESILLDKFSVLNELNNTFKIMHNKEIDYNIKLAYNYYYTNNTIAHVNDEVKELFKWYKTIENKKDFIEKKYFYAMYQSQIFPKDYNYYCFSNIIDYTITSEGDFIYCASDIFSEKKSYKTDDIFLPEKNEMKYDCFLCEVKKLCYFQCKFMQDEKEKNNFCLMAKNLYKNFILNKIK